MSLTIIGQKGFNRNRQRIVAVECSCGRRFEALFQNIRRGHTTSCGCAAREAVRLRRTTHGHCANRSATKLYNTWAAIIQRCENQNNTAYENYGGRGIEIAQEWRHSFEKFAEDMGEPPTNAHSIDRLNVNENYSKENCVWATATEQARNKRTNVITADSAAAIVALHHEQEFTIRALARLFEVSPSTVNGITSGRHWR